MNNAFEILGLESHANEAEIRRRYLELVREFPPERSPEKFAEVRAAYDHLRDPVSRLERELFFAKGSDSIGQIIRDLRQQANQKRIATKTLLELGMQR